mmetsp:Transcript_5489/g.12074  ORF Transcript_5489/g.12074 Transcript_5489/m.12074 type:complete len:282 (-) Transcript_5489:269-1114(-)
MQSTARVRVPGPHLALHDDQGPGTQWQPVVSTHSSTASGLLRVRQSSSCPVLHSTFREWVPLPQAVEHTPQVPVCHLASPSCALPELPTTPSLGGRVGTSSSHFGGFSHTILQSGLGHSFGFWHFQSQTGSGHTVLHFKASLHKNRHWGFSHRVLHLGLWQSRVLRPSQMSFGQNIRHWGAAHCTLHAFKCSAASLGHRVWHWGRWHLGSQSCSQTGCVQFHVQCGTQLLRWSSGTSWPCLPWGCTGTCAVAPPASTETSAFNTVAPAGAESRSSAVAGFQ